MTSATCYVPVSSNGTLGPRFDYMTVALKYHE
jgi:hypothetical protein